MVVAAATPPPSLRIVVVEVGNGGMIPDGGDDGRCKPVGAGGGLGYWGRESGGGAVARQRGREGEGGGGGSRARSRRPPAAVAVLQVPGPSRTTGSPWYRMY